MSVPPKHERKPPIMKTKITIKAGDKRLNLWNTASTMLKTADSFNMSEVRLLNGACVDKCYEVAIACIETATKVKVPSAWLSVLEGDMTGKSLRLHIEAKLEEKRLDIAEESRQQKELDEIEAFETTLEQYLHTGPRTLREMCSFELGTLRSFHNVIPAWFYERFHRDLITTIKGEVNERTPGTWVEA